MVGVVVRLKLRVLRHSLRGRRAVLFALGAVYGLLGAVLTALLPLAADDAGTATDLVALTTTVWALGWVVGPIAFGGDESVRPENFALLPLRPVALARAMGAASLVGVAPVVTAVAFTAHVWAGTSGGAGPALVGIPAAAGELALVVLASRTVVAGIGAVLASRRGRDVGALLAALALLALLPLQFLSQLLEPVLSGGGLGTLGVVLRAVPTGWGAVAVRAAVDGDVLLVVAPLVGLAVLCAVLTVVWARLLDRRLTVAAVTAGPGTRAVGRERTGPGTPRRGRGPLGAVVVKELRLWRRDTRRRAGLLTAVVMAIVLPFAFSAGSTGTVGWVAVYLAVLGVSQLANGYGLDGGSMWPVLVVPDAARADVRGRQLAWLALFVPLALLAAVAGPLVAGSSSVVVWLAGLLPVLLGAGSGLVVLQSAVLPYALPPGSNPFNQGSGAGCTKTLSVLAFLLLLVPAALPVVALVLAGRLAGLGWLSWLGAPVGLAVGVGLAWWWGAIAVRRVETRGPEILAEVRAAV